MADTSRPNYGKLRIDPAHVRAAAALQAVQAKKEELQTVRAAQINSIMQQAVERFAKPVDYKPVSTKPLTIRDRIVGEILKAPAPNDPTSLDGPAALRIATANQLAEQYLKGLSAEALADPEAASKAIKSIDAALPKQLAENVNTIAAGLKKPGKPDSPSEQLLAGFQNGVSDSLKGMQPSQGVKLPDSDKTKALIAAAARSNPQKWLDTPLAAHISAVTPLQIDPSIKPNASFGAQAVDAMRNPKQPNAQQEALALYLKTTGQNPLTDPVISDRKFIKAAERSLPVSISELKKLDGMSPAEQRAYVIDKAGIVKGAETWIDGKPTHFFNPAEAKKVVSQYRSLEGNPTVKVVKRMAELTADGSGGDQNIRPEIREGILARITDPAARAYASKMSPDQLFATTPLKLAEAVKQQKIADGIREGVTEPTPIAAKTKAGPAPKTP